MKSKLLPILLILLLLLNGVLIFMMVKKPHENQRINPTRNFLTEQLSFTETQKASFKTLDVAHRQVMRGLEDQLKDQKDILFDSFNKKDFKIDSLTTKIGLLQAKKDAEVFSFFKQVREICTADQVQKFDKIIKEAIRGGDRMPPNDGNMPPPGNERMPPPPR
ncbi:Spy/CpxP family protein refolding chaperone [Polaribacter sp. AHE13PA]|uniref:Spy/CpxP family protein refolding chaperone n=1 Tax=Polaribacter sp. AHE13PA TaxID=2745562 RepID=UPI001C4EABB1|nr:hypothetical protein [Polaribacter sp. AHE13PA]QXP68104.1 hypothetical protein H0I28_06265 [Polaribacter sp. AHE13PA]